MLANYDAKAVAEVLGLAFERAAREGKDEDAGATAAKIAGQFVIYVDREPVRVVEMKAKSPSTPAEASRPSGARLPRAGRRSARALSPAFIEKAVEIGLPRNALRRVAERIAGGDEAKASAVERGVIPKTTLERRESKLSPRESERTERIARLFVHARRALGSEPEAREFMTAAHPELDGRSPVEAAKTDLGARHAEQILNALEYGLAL